MAALMPVAVRVLAANRLESKDAEDESQVSKASEEEEQGIEAFGRLATSVEQDLRHAAAQVEDCTNVAEDLSPEREVQGGCLVVCVGTAVFVVGLRLWGGRAEVVTRDARNDDEHNGCAIEKNSLKHGACLCRFCACRIAQLLGLRMHGGGRRQHGSIEVVEVVAVR